jgi:hypothetical protein
MTISHGDVKKACFKCGTEKSLSEYYRHPKMADGHLGKCKDCTKRDVGNNYRANREHYREYERQRANLPHRVQAREVYAATEAGRMANGKSNRKWREKNPEKYRAEYAVSNAIRDGRLIRQPFCTICRSTRKVEAHHHDYSDVLGVTWFCKKHHLLADIARRSREAYALLF